MSAQNTSKGCVYTPFPIFHSHSHHLPRLLQCCMAYTGLSCTSVIAILSLLLINMEGETYSKKFEEELEHHRPTRNIRTDLHKPAQ